MHNRSLPVHQGARCLALELIEGETLAGPLARGALPLEEALEVARQVAAGVEAAHENGGVHRDLKPGKRGGPSGVAGECVETVAPLGAGTGGQT